MKIQLETLNKQNLNGRTYTKECIEKCIADTKPMIDGRRFIVKTPYSNTPVGLVTNLEIIDDKFFTEIELLETDVGKLVKAMIEDGRNFQFSMVGRGYVVDGVVKEYVMEHISCDM
jgi:hypothetical protein